MIATTVAIGTHTTFRRGRNLAICLHHPSPRVVRLVAAGDRLHDPDAACEGAPSVTAVAPRPLAAGQTSPIRAHGDDVGGSIDEWPTVEARSLDSPDAAWTFLDGSERLAVQLRQSAIGRGVYRPGWRWSEHVQPLSGSESREHVGSVISGRMAVCAEDGTEVAAATRGRQIVRVVSAHAAHVRSTYVLYGQVALAGWRPRPDSRWLA
jgi:hypothetical protein